jgi:excisionase family DNA binding protein
MPLSNLKTTIEAAVRLQCSRRYIATLVKRKKLEPAAKLPGKTGAYLFAEAELERFERCRNAACCTSAAHAEDAAA